MIGNSNLQFTNATQLNDPFDCHPKLFDYSNVPEKIYIEGFLKNGARGKRKMMQPIFVTKHGFAVYRKQTTLYLCGVIIATITRAFV